MRITENRLRRLIRTVIAETIDDLKMMSPQVIYKDDEPEAKDIIHEWHWVDESYIPTRSFFVEINETKNTIASGESRGELPDQSIQLDKSLNLIQRGFPLGNLTWMLNEIENSKGNKSLYDILSSTPDDIIEKLELLISDSKHFKRMYM